MTVHENMGGGGDLGDVCVKCCLFLIELNKVVVTPHFSAFVKSLVRSEAEVLWCGEILK